MKVDDYLRRLELSATPAIDDEGLALLHERHMETVPFENLDIVRGEPVGLDIDRILDKIVHRRRGGFCYELNAAFHWLLGALGFDVRMLEARVAREEGGWGIPFDHLALALRLPDGERLVDVGFGDGFVRPLDLAERDEVHRIGQIFRLRDDDDGLVLERHDRRAMGYVPVYLILPEERRLEDFEPGWRHHTTSPDSPFTRAPICSIAAPDGRISLTRDELVITRNGRRVVQPVADEVAYRDELRRYFRINLD